MKRLLIPSFLLTCLLSQAQTTDPGTAINTNLRKLGSNYRLTTAADSAYLAGLRSGNISVGGGSSTTVSGITQAAGDLRYKAIGYVPTWTEILAKPTFFSGAYADLTGKPALFSGSYLDLTNRPTLFSGSYTDLISKPTLFSGAYVDLTGKPLTFAPSAHTHSGTDITQDATHRFVTDAQIAGWNSSTGSGFSGNYADLIGKPTLFSGSYLDLTSKPTIPSTAAEVGAVPLSTYTTNRTADQSATTSAQNTASSALSTANSATSVNASQTISISALQTDKLDAATYNANVPGYQNAAQVAAAPKAYSTLTGTPTIPQPVTTLTGLSNTLTKYQSDTQVAAAIAAIAPPELYTDQGTSTNTLGGAGTSSSPLGVNTNIVTRKAYTDSLYSLLAARITTLESQASGLPTLSAPVITAGAVTTSTIGISYAAVTNATYYTIQRSLASNFSSPTSFTTASLTPAVSGLLPSTQYYIRAYAGASGYNTSTASNVVTATTATTSASGGGSNTEFVTLTSPSSYTTDNQFTGYAGFKVQVGSAPIVVTNLGRYKFSGNSQTHILRIYSSDQNTVVYQTTVDLSTGTAGTYVYSATDAVTLAANTVYYFFTGETANSDVSASGIYGTTTTTDAQVIGRAGLGFETIQANTEYAIINFKYHL